MNPTGGEAPGTTPAFPWDDALMLGLGTLRWHPRAFWHATPRELLSAAGPRAAEPLRREALARLIADHPDAE